VINEITFEHQRMAHATVNLLRMRKNSIYSTSAESSGRMILRRSVDAVPIGVADRQLLQPAGGPRTPG